VLYAQAQQVYRSYWIPPVTSQQALLAFSSWSTGTEVLVRHESYLWLAFLAGCVGWLIWRADRAGWFFLLQATVPWMCSLGISWWSGRSIFVERYLAFAQLSLLALWGVIWCRLTGGVARLLLAGLLCPIGLSGLWTAIHRFPDRPAAMVLAAGYLKEHWKPGDVILVGHPSSVNRLRCYAAQAGLPALDVRCQVNPFTAADHYSHAVALTSDDVLSNELRASTGKAQRVWRTSEVAWRPPPGMHLVLHQVFVGEGDSSYELALFERVE
jgi:hypothetical protein